MPDHKILLAWHFLKENRELRWNSAGRVRAGRIYTAKGELEMCINGMHASRRAMDALAYAPGPIACRVECWGEVIEQDDKLVSRHRKVLWWVDATHVLHEFACRCAEDALALTTNPDPRSVAAITAKRRWLRGQISEEELAASWDAWAFARPSRSSGWISARAARTGWAARAAAGWASAWISARASAWVSARDVWDARDAARARQNRRLVQMLIAARRARRG